MAMPTHHTGDLGDGLPTEPHHHNVPVAGCYDCEMIQSILDIEFELRHHSLDLWVAGWTPDELLEHVRTSVADRRAVDLVAHAIVVDDSHRNDHARPPEWRAAIQRLRTVAGVDDVEPGWYARWIRANSTLDTCEVAARCLADLLHALRSLQAPAPERAAG
ncbi:MAG: hypothetical protein AAFP84_01590 [Actinomycetota bacterium]